MNLIFWTVSFSAFCKGMYVPDPVDRPKPISVSLIQVSKVILWMHAEPRHYFQIIINYSKAAHRGIACVEYHRC